MAEAWKRKDDAPREPATFEGRVPPHDVGAERAVLSAVLTGGVSYLDEVSETMRAEHCYVGSHRLIFEAAMEIAAVGQPVDSVTVATRLREADRLAQVGGMAYLADLLGVAFGADFGNVRAHAKIVVDRWRARQVILACQVVAARGYLEPGLASDYAADAAEKIHVLAHSSSMETTQRAGEVLREAMRDIALLANSKRTISGTPTKMRRLDRVIAGLHPGDLSIIAGRPGMGKTSLALQIAVNVAEGDEVQNTPPSAAVFFSLEMPKKQIVLRATCSEGRVDQSKLRLNQWSPYDWQKVTAAATKMAGLPLWFDDKPAISVMEIRARLRRIQAELARKPVLDAAGNPEIDAGGAPVFRKLGVAVVDYLQLMKASKDIESREQQVSEISRSLKELAKELHIPVIALSQLNRGLESRSDKRPQLSDLRESGAIEQDADNILFCYRDEYYTKSQTKYPGLVEIEVAKQRSGPSDTVTMKWLGMYTRFEDLPDGEGEAYDRGGD